MALYTTYMDNLFGLVFFGWFFVMFFDDLATFLLLMCTYLTVFFLYSYLNLIYALYYKLHFILFNFHGYYLNS